MANILAYAEYYYVETNAVGGSSLFTCFSNGKQAFIYYCSEQLQFYIMMDCDEILLYRYLRQSHALTFLQRDEILRQTFE